MRGGRRSNLAGLITLLVSVWLIVGAVAGGQRHYYASAPTNCASTATIAAWPLNYVGMNPKVGDCHVDLPQPSP